VTKKDIGPIRIFEDETKFAILGDILTDFTAAVAVTTDSEMSITPSTPPTTRPPPYERKREDRSAKPAYPRPSWRDVAAEVQQAEAPPRDKGMRQRKRKQLEKLAAQSGEKPAEFVKPPRRDERSSERPHGKHPSKFKSKHPGAKRTEEAAHRGKPFKGKPQGQGYQGKHKSEGKRRWQP
jgi:hypothetical protein